MKYSIHKIWPITLVILVVVICLVVFWPSQRVNDQVKVAVGKSFLTVRIAQTPEEHQRGLSGLADLAPDEGMLFIFPQKTVPTFWMKGMNFALDFMWVQNGLIVELAENIEPPPAGATTLSTYQPSLPVDQVIEVKAGWVKQHKIQVGDKVRVLYRL